MDDEEVKKGKPKWMLWAVIGIVAVVVIVVIIQFGGGGPSSASGLTVDDLSAIVSQQSTTIQGFTQWKATATEDLANLNTKQQQILSQLSGITSPKDWTSDMNKLKADFTALQESWQVSNATLGKAISGINATIEEAMAGINITLPRYAMVSLMTKYQGSKMQWYGDVFTNVEVYGQGNYPVVVTFYGSGLNESLVYWPVNSGYDVTTSLVYNYDCGAGEVDIAVGNETISVPTYECVPDAVELIAFVVPETGWDAKTLIQLGVDPGIGGSISYATATVGGTWLLPATPTPGDWPI